MVKWEYLEYANDRTHNHIGGERYRQTYFLNGAPQMREGTYDELNQQHYEYLENLGDDGWELVAVEGGTYYFKPPSSKTR
jgi:hypothetical protein